MMLSLIVMEVLEFFLHHRLASEVEASLVPQVVRNDLLWLLLMPLLISSGIRLLKREDRIPEQVMIQLLILFFSSLTHLVRRSEGILRLICIGKLSSQSLARVQMEKGIVDLLHEHIALGLAEIAVIVPTELIVAVNKVTNLIHEPLDLLHGTDLICIAVHDSKRHVTDLVKRNVRRHSLFVVLLVRLGELLEPALDAVL